MNTEQLNDRIKILANAMGKSSPHFDPFTDANDDYAVLEWMREHNSKEKFDALNDLSLMRYYKIGDYARAALRIIDND